VPASVERSNAAAGPPLESDQACSGLPQRARQACGILRIERHVDRTGVLVFVENLSQVLPRRWCERRRVLCWVRRGAPARRRKAISDCAGLRSPCQSRASLSGRRTSRTTCVHRFPDAVAVRDLPRMQASPVPHINHVWDRTPRPRCCRSMENHPYRKSRTRCRRRSVDFHTPPPVAPIVGGWVARNSGGRSGNVRHEAGRWSVLHSPEERVFILVVFILSSFAADSEVTGVCFLRRHRVCDSALFAGRKSA